MDKNKPKFDSSCEFDGITKEELLDDINGWESEKTPYKIGKHNITIHPSRKKLCREITGNSYKEVLKAVLLEFANGGDEDTAIRNLFDFLGLEYNEDKLQDIIDYVMCAVIADYQNVLDKKASKVTTFKEVLRRDKAENLISEEMQRPKINK